MKKKWHTGPLVKFIMFFIRYLEDRERNRQFCHILLSRFSGLYLPLRFSNLPKALWERRSVARRPKITHPLFSSPQPSANSAGQSAQTACHRLPWTVSAQPAAVALLAVLQWLEIPQTKLSVLSKKEYLAVEFLKNHVTIICSFQWVEFQLEGHCWVQLICTWVV